MAQSSTTRSPVCSTSFQAMLVGGFGAQRAEVEEAAWGLAKMLFNHSERQRHAHYHDVKSIVNNAKILLEVPQADVDSVLAFMEKSTQCSQGITCVIFAHSHGAKVVAEALRVEQLTGYLQQIQHRSDGEVKTRISDIRRCLAVFAIGGIDRIPNTAAKVVLNARLETDAKSLLGEQIFGGSGGASTEMHIIRDKRPSNATTYEHHGMDKASQPAANSTFDQNAPGSNEGQAQPWTLAGIYGRYKDFKNNWFTPMRAVSTGNAKHVLGDYTFSDGLMQLIIDALCLDSGEKCGCQSQTNESLAEEKDTEKAAKI